MISSGRRVCQQHLWEIQQNAHIQEMTDARDVDLERKFRRMKTDPEREGVWLLVESTSKVV